MVDGADLELYNANMAPVFHDVRRNKRMHENISGRGIMSDTETIMNLRRPGHAIVSIESGIPKPMQRRSITQLG